MYYFTIFSNLDKGVIHKDITLILNNLKEFSFNIRFIDNGIIIILSSDNLFTKKDVELVVLELFEYSRVTFKDPTNNFWFYITNGVNFNELDENMNELNIKILI